jgi:hypothetical protein
MKSNRPAMLKAIVDTWATLIKGMDLVTVSEFVGNMKVDIKDFFF